MKNLKRRLLMTLGVITLLFLFTSCNKEENLPEPSPQVVVQPTNPVNPTTPPDTTTTDTVSTKVIILDVEQYYTGAPQVTSIQTDGFILEQYIPQHKYVVRLKEGQYVYLHTENSVYLGTPRLDISIGLPSDTTQIGLYYIPVTNSISSGASDIDYTYTNN